MSATLDAIVRRGARQSPDARAIVDGSVDWTWRAFDEQVTRAAGALRGLGVGPGDRVAAIGQTSAAYFAVMYGCARLGAVLSPLSYLSAPDELRYVIGNFDPTVVLAGAAFEPGACDAAASSAPSAPVVAFGTPGDEWDERLAAADPGLELPSPDPDAIHVVMYTSGTTGRPKGVCHSQRAHFTDALQTALGYGLRQGDSYVVHAPSFHGACWDHAKLFLLVDGFVVVLPRFEPLAVMEAIAEHGISVLFGVPAVLRQILAHPAFAEHDLSSIRLVLSGGALGAATTNREFEAALGRPVDFLQIYGLTEAGPFVSALSPALADEKPTSIGRPLPGVELAIVDPEAGTVLPQGGVGEIAVRSSTIMAGYWRNLEATTAAIRDGWLHTGDLGLRDADGDHFIVDRLKDMIRSGGENVYAAEVERVLLEHPAVLEAAVVGLPDERWDERVVAVLVPRPGITPEPDDVRAFCRERLAAYKVPKQVEVREALPKTGIGKVAKHELRAALSAAPLPEFIQTSTSE
jgi:acyl-CoA synthetase (AMP-forming)/AMP-acid ligase II